MDPANRNNRNSGEYKLGASGRPPSGGGSNGNLQGSPEFGVEVGEHKAFRDAGKISREPEGEDRSRAFECDESCREYTGDPMDAAGPRGRPAGTNPVMRQSLRNEGAL